MPTPPRPRAANRRIHPWLPKHPVAVWGVAALVAFGVLFGATQVAKDADQDVNWYSAFGVWLGAVASVFAGATALWIATTDRRREDQLRSANTAAEEARRARAAGLARVTLGKLVSAPRPPRISRAEAAVLANYRQGNIFDVQLICLRAGGAAVDKAAVRVDHYPMNGENPRPLEPVAQALQFLVVKPGQQIAFFVPGNGDVPADYAEIRYTDDTGRTWDVNSASTTAKLVDVERVDYG